MVWRSDLEVRLALVRRRDLGLRPDLGVRPDIGVEV